MQRHALTDEQWTRLQPLLPMLALLHVSCISFWLS
jgi:transposase